MKYKPKEKNVTKLKQYLNKITNGNINRKSNKGHL
jgi:hypothetical protein